MPPRPSAARLTSWPSATRASQRFFGARLTKTGRDRLARMIHVPLFAPSWPCDRLVRGPCPPYNSRTAVNRPGTPMSNARKILIIDDDDELHESLSEQLSLHEEFETVLAPTASEGLKQARNGHIDLVLLDVGLPDLDGQIGRA